jgi:hypothetical protein
MATILFIDDLRTPLEHLSDGNEVIVVRNPADATRVLAEQRDAGASFEAVFWDHDLGMDEETGVEIDTRSIVNWLIEQAVAGTPVDIKVSYVHTANPVAGKWLMESLSSYPLYHQAYRIDPLEVSTA